MITHGRRLVFLRAAWVTEKRAIVARVRLVFLLLCTELVGVVGVAIQCTLRFVLALLAVLRRRFSLIATVAGRVGRGVLLRSALRLRLI